MAKNHDRGDEEQDRIGIIEPIKQLSKRQNVLVASFMAIAAILLISFLIPSKIYNANWVYMLLNIELLILFARDIYLYYKRSCITIRSIMVLMTFIYLFNIIDFAFNLVHAEYINICSAAIVIAFGTMYFIRENE